MEVDSLTATTHLIPKLLGEKERGRGTAPSGNETGGGPCWRPSSSKRNGGMPARGCGSSVHLMRSLSYFGVWPLALFWQESGAQQVAQKVVMADGKPSNIRAFLSGSNPLTLLGVQRITRPLPQLACCASPLVSPCSLTSRMCTLVKLLLGQECNHGRL